ncbi:HNH endonuclease [Priestia megaterium]|uniref:HNH endonuclease n=1 Tax=Priestia megaterium TaxID=1404 RepID=UPI002878155C|nr:HNH endonuclease [Priestia megaterium]
MIDYQDVINALPKIYQSFYHRLEHNKLFECKKCKNTFPRNKFFFKLNNGTSDGMLGHCRNCEKPKLFYNLLKGNVNFNSINQIFKNEIPNGKKVCKCCLKLLNDDIETFTGKKATCRDCSGIKRLETNYYENMLLAKENKKRCKYCEEVKGIDEFNKVGKTRIQEFCKECKENNKKDRRSYYQEYFIENKDRKKEYYKEWKQNGGIEIRKTNEGSRRQKKLSLESTLTVFEWQECLDYFENSCAYCGIHNDLAKELHDNSLHQEHVVPVTKGGAFSKENIIPSCRICNSSKRNMDLEEYIVYADINKERYERILNYLNLQII